MKEHSLGEFEELVLLTVGILFDKAYGVAVKDELSRRLNRSISVGALQSALRRLEQKGYLNSQTADANPQRGGKPKRYFFITAQGKQALEHVRGLRNQLWDDIPKVALDL